MSDLTDDLQPIALSPRDAAKFIGRSRSGLYELMAEGKIEARKDGARTLVIVRSLEEYVESLPSWCPQDDDPHPENQTPVHPSRQARGTKGLDTNPS